MTVNLKHIDEFKQGLEGYEPSEATRAVLEKTELVIMLGVSGGGRNTIINHLINSGEYHFIVSDTTRPPKVRDGALEQDGVHYNFRSESEVLDDLQAGRFLEAELIHNQQVSGISIRELEKAINSGKIPINEVDLGGTEAILHAKPDAKFFFIVPPSYKEWMYRLHGREVMSEQEMQNRIETAVRVLEKGLAHDHFQFVINDSSHRSAELIDRQVHGMPDHNEHEQGQKAAREILETIKRHTGTR